MRALEITDSDIKYAEDRSKLCGVMNGSRTNGKGNVVGFLGEVLVSRLLNTELSDTYDYDLIYDGEKIDVKTKSCSSEPKPDYLCSVMAYQIKNDCDRYIFVRVNLSDKKAWILGQISKAKILGGKFALKGEKDGAFTFTEDCWSVKIKELEEL